MLIGIDLLWVRPGICGGTESYIRNLMTGFGTYDAENRYVLFLARDNAESFAYYKKYSNFSMITCPINCANQGKRILWENLHLDKYAKRHCVDVMFIPVYSKPITWGSRIPYLTVIHDLQSLHYPEYFSTLRKIFFRFEWLHATITSKHVVADSDYGKNDLCSRYPWVKNKISTLYAPIMSLETGMEFSSLEKKYGIFAGGYYYCVSSQLKHKNLKTILEVMDRLKADGKAITLVVSGVGGNLNEFLQMIKDLGIEDIVINTGYVSDKERDCLYENCRLFLFPSIFEGFGMPPIEAMRKGKRVVMTERSCLYEVTEGKATYVDDPYDVCEWIKKINLAERESEQIHAFEQYSLQAVSKKFIELFRNAF